jgi:hypothetical protein
MDRGSGFGDHGSAAPNIDQRQLIESSVGQTRFPNLLIVKALELVRDQAPADAFLPNSQTRSPKEGKKVFPRETLDPLAGHGSHVRSGSAAITCVDRGRVGIVDGWPNKFGRQGEQPVSDFDLI